MNIAVDISPLKSGHRYRGIGKYTQKLVDNLQKVDCQNRFFLISDKDRRLISQADLIHYPFFDLFFLTLPVVKRVKTVVTIHDLIPLVFPVQYPPGIRGKIKFGLQKLSLKNTKAVITDSYSSKRDILRFLKIPANKIFIVYLAPDEDFRPLGNKAVLAAIREKYRLPPSFVLYVGDVNYNKNVLGLIKACLEIKMPVVIIGKQAVQSDFNPDHPENQPLALLIKVYGDNKGVIRLGFVPTKDLVAIYNLASVYCQPSFYEGFGLPLLEAMRCGCPVVSSNRSSLPEVCGKAAVLVNPKPDGLARGLKLVLNDLALRKKLVEKGFRQASNFSWIKTARKTIEIYEKVYQQR
ncbi:MAG TPA: glycosyltransferase family 1 protein [Candidatus Bathyarchaeia archaeon]|nr:glycosyltransferase family 1 protein [Candidatus Bathyarchaeia archaeon]